MAPGRARFDAAATNRCDTRPVARWRTATAAAAALIYLALWVGIERGWSWLGVVDRRLLEPAYEFGRDHPGWVHAWDVFCLVLGPDVLRVATMVLVIVLLRRRRVWPAMFLFVCVVLSWAVTQFAKELADRPRPSTALVSAWSSSFPSGHALGVLVAVLALLTVLLPSVPRRRRAWVMAAGAVLVVAIGAGRVVLNVHHPSDVVAGWALGYLYYLACLPLLGHRDGGPVDTGTGDPLRTRSSPHPRAPDVPRTRSGRIDA